MSDEPTTITLAKLAELITGLGITTPTSQIRSITMTPGKAEIVRYRLSEHGRPYVVGDEVATETIVIAIEQRAYPTPIPQRRRRPRCNTILAAVGILAAAIAIVATILSVVTG